MILRHQGHLWTREWSQIDTNRVLMKDLKVTVGLLISGDSEHVKKIDVHSVFIYSAPVVDRSRAAHFNSRTSVLC